MDEQGQRSLGTVLLRDTWLRMAEGKSHTNILVNLSITYYSKNHAVEAGPKVIFLFLDL